MKQQLVLAFKFIALSGVYLFTRSRTPPEQRRFPEKSLAVLFLLENLKRVLVQNGRLIGDATSQVELLENDIRLFRAFLEESVKIRDRNEALEELVAEMEAVVREAEGVIAAFRCRAAENRDRNFLQKTFCSGKLVSVANEVKVVRAKVKVMYEKSRVFSANR